jgi:hypothetical protein
MYFEPQNPAGGQGRSRVRRIVSAIALMILATAMLMAQPDLAGATVSPTPPSRTPSLASHGVPLSGAGVGAQDVQAADVLGGGTLSDAVGDETFASQSDITSLGVSYRTNSIGLNLQTVVMVNPGTDYYYTHGQAFVAFEIMVANGTVYDAVGAATPGGALTGLVNRLTSGGPVMTCRIPFSFSPTEGYILALSPACIGGVSAHIAVRALTYYGQTSSPNDAAPDASFTNWIAPQPALPYWPGRDVARGVALVQGFIPSGGYVLDEFGGLHPYSPLGVLTPAAEHGAPYWPGFAIARGVAMIPGTGGGYVLDGYGGLHPFGTGASPAPPATHGGGYWRGWDIARGVAILPNGTGGYVVDAYGGLHGFAIGNKPMPPAVKGPYWATKLARGVAATPDGGLYVLDAFGGLHPIGTSPAYGGPYWSGRDLARGVSYGIFMGSGVVVDAYGGLHSFTGP